MDPAPVSSRNALGIRGQPCRYMAWQFARYAANVWHTGRNYLAWRPERTVADNASSVVTRDEPVNFLRKKPDGGGCW